MPWFKVDDNLAFHAKVVMAGNDALGLWVRAGSWCAQQLTDGVVPTHVVSVLGTPRQARRLVEAGLWETHQQGFVFHEWADRQPSRDDVEAKREAARERMSQVRARRSQSVRANEDGTNERTSSEVRLTPTRPDPTRPVVPSELLDETPTSSRQPRKRGTRLPADYAATDAMKQWAAENTPGVNGTHHAKFVDYWTSVPGAKGVKLDWTATWRNWMRNEHERMAPRQSSRPTPTDNAQGFIDMIDFPRAIEGRSA